MQSPEVIIINTKKFTFVRRSRRGKIDIYKGDGTFLRVGTKSKINKHIRLHQKLADLDFPVPKIIEVGEHLGQKYYIETSLGEKHFGILFKESFEKTGKISDELFGQFLKITESYARAQIKTAIKQKNFANLRREIQLDILLRELVSGVGSMICGRAACTTTILEKFREAKKHMRQFPFVLTHGDFNPHNLFPKGVIDFEHLYYAPAGFDLVSNIFHMSFFPESGNYEYKKSYDFSEEQKESYFKMINAVFAQNGVPDVSSEAKYFEFCRAIWQTVKNNKVPKLQEWRYERFKKLYL